MTNISNTADAKRQTAMLTMEASGPNAPPVSVCAPVSEPLIKVFAGAVPETAAP
jgi:hypothetical protein